MLTLTRSLHPLLSTLTGFDSPSLIPRLSQSSAAVDIVALPQNSPAAMRSFISPLSEIPTKPTCSQVGSIFIIISAISGCDFMSTKVVTSTVIFPVGSIYSYSIPSYDFLMYYRLTDYSSEGTAWFSPASDSRIHLQDLLLPLYNLRP